MIRPLTILQSENGSERVDVESIVYVSAPLTKKGHAESRVIQVGPRSVYVLNSIENCRVLELPEAEATQPDAQPAPKKRGRKAKP